MAFSSLFIGATGMKTHSEGLQVTSNNLANVNTTAYKNTQARFADLISRTVTTGAVASVGLSQSGLGSTMNYVATDFSQGALEATNTATDMAITGRGFFQVVSGDKVHYTRSGVFRFDSTGYLVDPAGFRVQGAAGDIALPVDADGYVSQDPQATTQVTLTSNLQRGDYEIDPNNPYFSLFNAWDGVNQAANQTVNAAYSNSIRIYDSVGNSHDLQINYDQVTTGAGTPAGSRIWEYTVTMDPDEDVRQNIAGTDNAGMLMTGTLTFNSSGLLVDQSAFTYDGSGNPESLANWTPATFSAQGYPEFTADFSSSAGNVVAMNMGLSNASGNWSGGPATAQGVGLSAGNLPSMGSPNRGNYATTNFQGSSSMSIYANQDGYARGYLTGVYVTAGGDLRGRFTNNQEMSLGQISLYYFPSEYNLHREGGNHFSATAASGEAIQGVPGEGPLGTIVGGALEQSNVDMAREFVTMILDQRGFQANSKIITTSDQMLQMAANIKR